MSSGEMSPGNNRASVRRSRIVLKSLRSNQVTAIRSILAGVVCFMSLSAVAQTAEELVAKNLQAKGGVDKIKAIKSVRMTGNFDAGGIKATVGTENKRPDMVRETFSVQG